MGGLPNQMGGLDFLAPPCPPVSPPIGETLPMGFEDGVAGSSNNHIITHQTIGNHSFLKSKLNKK